MIDTDTRLRNRYLTKCVGCSLGQRPYLLHQVRKLANIVSQLFLGPISLPRRRRRRPFRTRPMGTSSQQVLLRVVTSVWVLVAIRILWVWPPLSLPASHWICHRKLGERQPE